MANNNTLGKKLPLVIDMMNKFIQLYVKANGMYCVLDYLLDLPENYIPSNKINYFIHSICAFMDSMAPMHNISTIPAQYRTLYHAWGFDVFVCIAFAFAHICLCLIVCTRGTTLPYEYILETITSERNQTERQLKSRNTGWRLESTCLPCCDRNLLGIIWMRIVFTIICRKCQWETHSHAHGVRMKSVWAHFKVARAQWTRHEFAAAELALKLELKFTSNHSHFSTFARVLWLWLKHLRTLNTDEIPLTAYLSRLGPNSLKLIATHPGEKKLKSFGSLRITTYSHSRNSRVFWLEGACIALGSSSDGTASKQFFSGCFQWK